MSQHSETQKKVLFWVWLVALIPLFAYLSGATAFVNELFGLNWNSGIKVSDVVNPNTSTHLTDFYEMATDNLFHQIFSTDTPILLPESGTIINNILLNFLYGIDYLFYGYQPLSSIFMTSTINISELINVIFFRLLPSVVVLYMGMMLIFNRDDFFSTIGNMSSIKAFFFESMIMKLTIFLMYFSFFTSEAREGIHIIEIEKANKLSGSFQTLTDTGDLNKNGKEIKIIFKKNPIVSNMVVGNVSLKDTNNDGVGDTKVDYYRVPNIIYYLFRVITKYIFSLNGEALNIPLNDSTTNIGSDSTAIYYPVYIETWNDWIYNNYLEQDVDWNINPIQIGNNFLMSFHKKERERTINTTKLKCLIKRKNIIEDIFHGSNQRNNLTGRSRDGKTVIQHTQPFLENSFIKNKNYTYFNTNEVFNEEEQEKILKTQEKTIETYIKQAIKFKETQENPSATDLYMGSNASGVAKYTNQYKLWFNKNRKQGIFYESNYPVMNDLNMTYIYTDKYVNVLLNNNHEDYKGLKLLPINEVNNMLFPRNVVSNMNIILGLKNNDNEHIKIDAINEVNTTTENNKSKFTKLEKIQQVLIKKQIGNATKEQVLANYKAILNVYLTTQLNKKIAEKWIKTKRKVKEIDKKDILECEEGSDKLECLRLTNLYFSLAFGPSIHETTGIIKYTDTTSQTLTDPNNSTINSLFVQGEYKNNVNLLNFLLKNLPNSNSINDFYLAFGIENTGKFFLKNGINDHLLEIEPNGTTYELSLNQSNKTNYNNIVDLFYNGEPTNIGTTVKIKNICQSGAGTTVNTYKNYVEDYITPKWANKRDQKISVDFNSAITPTPEYQYCNNKVKRMEKFPIFEKPFENSLNQIKVELESYNFIDSYISPYLDLLLFDIFLEDKKIKGIKTTNTKESIDNAGYRNIIKKSNNENKNILYIKHIIDPTNQVSIQREQTPATGTSGPSIFNLKGSNVFFHPEEEESGTKQLLYMTDNSLEYEKEKVKYLKENVTLLKLNTYKKIKNNKKDKVITQFLDTYLIYLKNNSNELNTFEKINDYILLLNNLKNMIMLDKTTNDRNITMILDNIINQYTDMYYKYQNYVDLEKLLTKESENKGVKNYFTLLNSTFKSGVIGSQIQYFQNDAHSKILAFTKNVILDIHDSSSTTTKKLYEVTETTPAIIPAEYKVVTADIYDSTYNNNFDKEKWRDNVHLAENNPTIVSQTGSTILTNTKSELIELQTKQYEEIIVPLVKKRINEKIKTNDIVKETLEIIPEKVKEILEPLSKEPAFILLGATIGVKYGQFGNVGALIGSAVPGLGTIIGKGIGKTADAIAGAGITYFFPEIVSAILDLLINSLLEMVNDLNDRKVVNIFMYVSTTLNDGFSFLEEIIEKMFIIENKTNKNNEILTNQIINEIKIPVPIEGNNEVKEITNIIKGISNRSQTIESSIEEGVKGLKKCSFNETEDSFEPMQQEVMSYVINYGTIYMIFELLIKTTDFAYITFGKIGTQITTGLLLLKGMLILVKYIVLFEAIVILISLFFLIKMSIKTIIEMFLFIKNYFIGPIYLIVKSVLQTMKMLIYDYTKEMFIILYKMILTMTNPTNMKEEINGVEKDILNIKKLIDFLTNKVTIISISLITLVFALVLYYIIAMVISLTIVPYYFYLTVTLKMTLFHLFLPFVVVGSYWLLFKIINYIYKPINGFLSGQGDK